MKFKVFFLIFLTLFIILPKNTQNVNVKAESLEQSVNEQLEQIDISELENFYENIKENNNEFNIRSFIASILTGNYNSNEEQVLSIVFNKIIENLKILIPSFLSIIAISLLSVILNNIKGKLTNESVGVVVDYSALLVVVLIIVVQLSTVYTNSKNAIENLSELNLIMSPIILSLMVASGGNVSAMVYKPTALMFSNLVVNTIVKILFPIISFIIILTIISCVSTSIKFNKLVDFAKSIFKWIIGLITSIYAIYLTTQGITSSIHDGISLKAAKMLSSSVPIVGGFLKNGFDFFVAGSILIKNSLGFCAVVIVLFIILSPIVSCAVFSILLKFLGGITQTIKCDKISELCTTTSNAISLINVATILVGVMSFTSFFLMILSANAFI